ncbi:MAG: CPBP family glutamic-type intramembrane protease [Rhodocyclaceae bacterium]
MHALPTLPDWPALIAFCALFAAMAAQWLAPGQRGRLIGALLSLPILLTGAGSLFDTQAILPLASAAALLALQLWRPSRLYLIALVAWSIAAALHLWPGFTPLQWSTEFGRHGQPLNWRIDKGIAGLLLVMAWRRSDAPAAPRPRYALLLLPCGVLLIGLLAMALGLARPDPRWLPLLPVWLLGNLFLTVVAEEVLFRGLLQGGLTLALSRHQPKARLLALLLSALLFGLVHVHWGWRFALLATLAGGLYGWFAGNPPRLGRAITAHWLTNAMLLICMDSPLG